MAGSGKECWGRGRGGVQFRKETMARRAGSLGGNNSFLPPL
jgi:hypothetical protein